MAVTMSKTQMAQAAGMSYDVAADQYVMPDGTRIDAFDVAQGRIGYGQLTGPTGPAPTQQYYSNNTGGAVVSNGWASSMNIPSMKLVDTKKEVVENIVGKIKDKYKDRDLIMIKTADLIRLIESV